MFVLVRYLLFLFGLLVAIPLIGILVLLRTTPITTIGALYLLACLVIVAAMLSAPRWHRSFLLLLIGTTFLFVIMALRLAFPPTGTRLMLTTLPAQTGPRWLNRLFDERDVVLFGAQLGPYFGAVSPAEAQDLAPTLAQTYREMQAHSVTSLSPFLTTYLRQQDAAVFDVLISESTEGEPPNSAIIFLHGYGGNFTLQCWLVAQAGAQIGALTICPSTSRYGDWWSGESTAILNTTLSYLQQRGIERIYLAGLSNGGLGASQLAARFEQDLSGLILISGADSDATITSLPVLIIQGHADERMPTALIERYVAAAGPNSTYRLFQGDHFVLLKQADTVQQAIVTWLIEQEDDWEGE